MNPLRFIKKSISYTTLGSTQSHAGVFCDIEGFVQKIASRCKSEKPNNISGIDKVHLKSDSINSILNGLRQTVFFCFALDKPPGHNIKKKLRVKLFKKVNKSVLSHITSYLEDDDHKPFHFNGETLHFTCQLMKIE